MRRSKSSLWWRDSNKTASGKAGAVQPVRSIQLPCSDPGTFPRQGDIPMAIGCHRDLLPPPDDLGEVDHGGAELIEGASPVRIELDPRGRLVKPKPADHQQALSRRTDRLNADVLAVQEVENMTALREFNAMLDAPYRFVALIEGNDPRFIDVGVLSRLPIGSATSYRWVPDPANPSRFLFSRDLLAVEIMNHARDQQMFTIWITHLKSKFIDPAITDPADIQRAQERNDDRRTRQAQEVHDIIASRHDVAQDRFIVCGDLNDHPGNAPVDPLLNGALNIHDVFAAGLNVDFERPENEGPRISNPEDIPADQNWTHRFSQSNAPDIYERLDHMLLSEALHGSQIESRIQRRTHWSKSHSGTDHDAVAVDLNLNP